MEQASGKEKVVLVLLLLQNDGASMIPASIVLASSTYAKQPHNCGGFYLRHEGW